MEKCISCGKINDQEAMCQHYDGGFVCTGCIGTYFTCPDCGKLFDQNDRVNGDQGNGFCIDCAADH